MVILQCRFFSTQDDNLMILCSSSLTFFSVCLLSPGAFPYGGSVMVSQTVGTAPMSHKHVLNVTAQLDGSSARMGTAPIRFFCVMATMIALMDLMKMLHSAVCYSYILVYLNHGCFHISPFHTLNLINFHTNNQIDLFR